MDFTSKNIRARNQQRSSSDKAYISLVDMITRSKFSNRPNVFKIGLFR